MFIAATRFAQDSQKRACLQGTSASPSRGATKQTSHVVHASASAAAVCGAAGVENAGVDSRGGKCRSGKCRRDNVWKTVRTENS